MKLYMIILASCIVTLTSAQELKKQKRGNELYQESFSLLKSDKNSRHGEYANSKNGKVNITGHYENNRKVGEWKFYQNGSLVQSYDYSTNAFIVRNQSSNYMVFDGNKYIVTLLPDEPTYIGGNPGIERALNDVIEYPEQARRMGVEGVVLISVIIDEEGKMGKLEFLGGPVEFRNEIKNGLSRIEQLWIPGSNQGNVKVKCKLFYSMDFKLEMCGGYGCSTMFIN